MKGNRAGMMTIGVGRTASCRPVGHACMPGVDASKHKPALT
jgi:hypothetical protein